MGGHHGSLLQEFTTGGYCGSLLWEVIMGVYCGSLSWEVTQEFTTGGSMQMIWLVMVGTLHQSNAITMMSLLWWGALTNQNHAWPVGVYCRSLLWKVTVGVYCRSLPQEFTVGGYCRSLLQEFTMGGSMQMIWLAMVGTLNQSNAIIMMSLLWWGHLTNQNHAGPVGVYCRSLPQEVTVVGYYGTLHRSMWGGGVSLFVLGY